MKIHLVNPLANQSQFKLALSLAQLSPSLLLFGSYLSHYKSEYSGVKSNVGKPNEYNLISSYIASNQRVSQKCCC